MARKQKYSSRGKVLNHPAFTVASYFVFQGTRYMSWGERSYKLGLTIVFALLLMFAGLHPLPALLFGHLLNFLLNGQLPVLMRYVLSDVDMTRAKVGKALEKLERTAGRFGVVDILVFGSFSRHSMKPTSDLDLRFYHRPDFLSAFLAYIYAAYIRLWANLNFIPIDVFCFSQAAFLDRMRADENPALLFAADEMRRKYPNAQNVDETLRHNRALL